MAYDAENFQPTKVDPLQITDPRERLKYLAEFLRGLPAEKFDMNFSDPAESECGSACCIGGWANLLFAGRASVAADAAHLLGLNYDSSQRLFYSLGGGLNYSDVTRDMAARVLDHLIATGEVDWSKARA